MIVDNYSEIDGYNFLRRVDLLEGKEKDDGYRGVHLYYQKDNYHYQIEVQVWSKHDALFNTWAHTKLYKSGSNVFGKTIRQAYEAGKLNSTDDFNKTLLVLKGECTHG